MLNPYLDEFTASKHKFLNAMFSVVLATTTTFAFALPGSTAWRSLLRSGGLQG
jgi:hypothetical protein